MTDSSGFKNTIAADKRNAAEKEGDREKISIYQLHELGFRLLFNAQKKENNWQTYNIKSLILYVVYVVRYFTIFQL